MAESYMGSISKGAITIDSFLGINTLPGCGVNEFKRMQNMTTDYYPVMSTRPLRSKANVLIDGTEVRVHTEKDIIQYRAVRSGSGGTIFLKHSLSEADLEKLGVAKTIYCYAKRKSAEKFKKYYSYLVTDRDIYIRFESLSDFEKAKSNLKLKTTSTGTAVDIENEEDYIEAVLVATSLQSNIVYQDGYFYYVKDNSLVRRPLDKEQEKKLIPDLEGECKVELSGTSVVVSPSMSVYYFATGIIRSEGYKAMFNYDDVTVKCPDSSRPSYQLTIKNPYSQIIDDDSNIDFAFITKDGKEYKNLLLYNTQNAGGNFESLKIEIIDNYVNTDDEKKRKEFADNCLSYKGDGHKFSGQLKDGVFSKTEAIGYIYGFAPKLGFNPKFSLLYNNRMFACNHEGNSVHSSVIGKPYDFMTLEDGEASADWIEVVSSGQFTGIAAFGGNVYYFKEHCVHKLYGSSPCDWQLVMLPVNGVEDGAHKSVAVENDICIYKSTDGFYLFDGLTAAKISGKLGRNTIFPNENKNSLNTVEYSACIFKGKYYCGISDRITGKYTLYIYDINTGLWCAEDFLSDTGFVDLVRTNRDVYGVKADGDNISLISLSSGGEFPSNEKYETGFDWSMESGDMTLGYENNKYISKIQIRAEGEENTKIRVKIIADQKENKSVQFEFSPGTLDSFSYSPKPIRCDNFRVLLSGTGQAKIYSITLTVSKGSEIR